jgi:hypothetical protein
MPNAVHSVPTVDGAGHFFDPGKAKLDDIGTKTLRYI